MVFWIFKVVHRCLIAVMDRCAKCAFSRVVGGVSIYIYIYTHVRLHVLSICGCMHIYTYIYIHIYVHLHVHAHTETIYCYTSLHRSHMYRNTYVRKHPLTIDIQYVCTYIYIYTYICNMAPRPFNSSECGPVPGPSRVVPFRVMSRATLLHKEMSLASSWSKWSNWLRWKDGRCRPPVRMPGFLGSSHSGNSAIP